MGIEIPDLGGANDPEAIKALKEKRAAERLTVEEAARMKAENLMNQQAGMKVEDKEAGAEADAKKDVLE